MPIFNLTSKKLFLYFTLLPTLYSASAYSAVRIVPMKNLEFKLGSRVPADGEIYFSYTENLIPFETWANRIYSGPLMIKDEQLEPKFVPTKDQLRPPIIPVEMFEARSAGIVKKPISFFNETTLNRLETINKIDPTNIHIQLPDKSFKIKTTVPFPKPWSDIIQANRKLLPETVTDTLVITSRYRFIDLSAIDATPYDRIINELNIYAGKPQVLNIQAFVHFNHIAKWGNMTSLYYKVDENRTLIVNYFAIAIKEKDLRMGFGQIGVRSILLGQSVGFADGSAAINTDKGIGAGLPIYVRDLFSGMYNAWN